MFPLPSFACIFRGFELKELRVHGRAKIIISNFTRLPVCVVACWSFYVLLKDHNI